MKLLMLILPIFILNSCKEPEIPKTVCVFPKLPTYKTPKSREFKVKKYSSTESIIQNSDLFELVNNNTKFRKICSNYAVVNKRVNKEYQK